MCENPSPGEVIIMNTLMNEMKNYGHSNVVFHVNISISCDISDMFKYKGKTMDEYRHDPMLKLYREEYAKWYKTIYKPMNEEMTAAEERGEDHAQGWWKHSEGLLFIEYWHKTQPKDVIIAYELAQKRYDEADKACTVWELSNEPQKNILVICQEECDRLCNQGYDLEVKSDNYSVISFSGYLTRRQIEEFSANEEYGYMILWAEEEKKLDRII